ncbi:uncharacterized protein EDB93DRAFT_1253137 [Suillus bovinus]|uniref:uncharacterized protein n=1 Tax=Suillus bovinus TaxID=48563 RepID=UPI001B85E726|nr:uncharacterized protein EDB93DRAFT_1253137 [Suillus bovinus]KAG2139208.1 hypothetical protein EDB93DRAFT_1253137 [Suillus bovinus]
MSIFSTYIRTRGRTDLGKYGLMSEEQPYEYTLLQRQRWSLMTVLYLSVRYLGLLYVTLNIMGWIMYAVREWTGVVVDAMLWVIMITRLYAMYQGSRKILMLLIVTFLANNIFDGVVAVMTMMQASGEEFILSGTYQCQVNYWGRYRTPGFHYLDTWNFVGGPRAMSCSLDCGETLP